MRKKESRVERGGGKGMGWGGGAADLQTNN